MPGRVGRNPEQSGSRSRYALFAGVFNATLDGSAKRCWSVLFRARAQHRGARARNRTPSVGSSAHP